MKQTGVGAVLSWSFGQHILRLAVALVTTLGIARHLGPEVFGVYQSLLSWLLIFIALGNGGLQTVVIQKLAVSNNPHIVLGTAFKLRLAWTGLSTLLCVSFPVIFAWPEQELLGVLILLPVLFMQFGDLADYYFQSKLQVREVTIARSIGALITLIGATLGFYLQATLYWFVVVFVLEQLIGLVLLWWVNQKRGVPFKKWIFDIEMASALWKEAWPMLGASVGFILFTRIDVVMLGHMSTPTETGFYSASTRLAQLWSFVPMVIVGALFPRLARLREASNQNYDQQLQLAFTILGTAGIVFAIGLSGGAFLWIPLLFGSEYAPAIPMLAVQGFIAWLYFLRVGQDRLWVTEKMTYYTLIIHLSTALLNILFNAILIPKMGGLGAAWASLIAMGIGALVLPMMFKKTRHGVINARKGSLLGYQLLSAKGRQSVRQLLRAS